MDKTTKTNSLPVLPTEVTNRIANSFDLCSRAILALHDCIEKEISKAGLDPSDFFMSKEDESDVYTFDIEEFMSGGDNSTPTMVFRAELDGIKYAAVGNAVLQGKEITCDCIVVKLHGQEWRQYSDGNWIPSLFPVDFI